MHSALENVGRKFQSGVTNASRLPIESVLICARGNLGAILPNISITRALLALALSCALGACTTSQDAFRSNPKSIDQVTLCRTYLKSTDPVFQQDLAKELSRRNVPFYQCPELVQRQEAAAAAILAVALVGTAVAVCANNNCGGGGYAPRRYPGNCYSYYDRAADGSLCGHRSALSRPGGW